MNSSFLLLLVASVLVVAVVGSINKESLFIDCDDEAEVYLDGVQVTHPNMKDYTKISEVILPSDTQVIAISCSNTRGGPYGLRASTQSGLVTDTTWRCSSIREDNWMEAHFDDSSWEPAITNVTFPSSIATATQISSDAKWIWSHTGTNEAYCRKKIVAVTSLSILENGTRFEQRMNLAKEGLTVSVPAHGGFQAMSVFIAAAIDGNSNTEDNMVFKIGSHSALMDLPSEFKPEDIFNASEKYTEIMTENNEKLIYTVFINQERLSEEEVTKLNPAIKSFVESGSVSRVRPRNVTKEQFKKLQSGEIISSINDDKQSEQSTISQSLNRYKRSSDDDIQCEKFENSFTQGTDFGCWRWINPGTGAHIPLHNIMAMTDITSISCCDSQENENKPSAAEIKRCCEINFPSLCTCDDPKLKEIIWSPQLLATCGTGITPIVNGNWSDWNKGPCSVTCGDGIQNYTRECNNPPPFNGGDPCSGEDTKIEKCNDKPCPGLTSHGEQCLDNCEKRGYPYFWCKKETSDKGQWSYADFCSPFPNVTQYGKQCEDGCEQRGEIYYWCHRQIDSGWGYCSPSSV